MELSVWLGNNVREESVQTDLFVASTQTGFDQDRSDEMYNDPERRTTGLAQTCFKPSMRDASKVLQLRLPWSKWNPAKLWPDLDTY